MSTMESSSNLLAYIKGRCRSQLFYRLCTLTKHTKMVAEVCEGLEIKKTWFRYCCFSVRNSKLLPDVLHLLLCQG